MRTIEEITADIPLDRLEEICNAERNGLCVVLAAPLDIVVKCTLCANPIKSDSGCDGNCTVDKRLEAKLINALTEALKGAEHE